MPKKLNKLRLFALKTMQTNGLCFRDETIDSLPEKDAVGIAQCSKTLTEAGEHVLGIQCFQCELICDDRFFG